MKYIILINILLITSTYATSPKFSFRDSVRVKKTFCYEECKFYKLDRKNSKCSVINYTHDRDGKDIIIYTIDCKEVPRLLEFQEYQLEKVSK